MRVSAMEGHTIWAHLYDAEINPLLALDTRVASKFMGPVPFMRFVDVACGTGRWMCYLCDRGGNVFGGDACEAMLTVAKQKRGLRDRCVLAEAACLPFIEGFADVTICSFAAGYLPDLTVAARELARVTRRGGRVIVSDLHPFAIAAGWTRSFRTGSSVYEIEHFKYSDEQFRSAGERAGLSLEHQLDVSFGEPERALFKRAGKEDLFYEISKVPAVWIGVWQKP
jgi:ubiquinone/menaquinone biosynthesis C-methylase UbiE